MNRNFRPRTPAGNNNEARRFEDIHEHLHPARRPMPAPPMPALGNGGDSWPPKNYPDVMTDVKAYAVGEWVYVRETDEAVTVGVIDPDSGAQVFSEPGIYRALRAVPLVPDGSGGFKYHIPLPTLPVPSDISDAKNFWAYFPQLNC